MSVEINGKTLSSL